MSEETDPIVIHVNSEFPLSAIIKVNHLLSLHNGTCHLNKHLFWMLKEENRDLLFSALETHEAGQKVQAVYVRDLNENEPAWVKTMSANWGQGDDKPPIELSLEEWFDLGYHFDEEPAQFYGYWVEEMFKRNGREVVLKRRG